MGKLRKQQVDEALEAAAADAPPPPPAVVFGPGEDPIIVPPGGPRNWTLADILTGIGIPLDKIERDTAAAAQRSGLGGIPAKVLQRILNEHVSPVQREQLLMALAVGVVQTLQQGGGPIGFDGGAAAG